MTTRPHFGFLGRLAAATVVVASAIAVVGWFDGSPASVDAEATQTVAMYEMNEPAGATTLIDTSGNGLNGASGPNNVKGVVFDGATAHRYNDRSPTQPPAEPERLDTVPHNALLNPESADFAVTVRYRTSKPFGNLIQKGQNNTAGGYFKIELPFGRPTCLFIGTDANGTELPAGIEAPIGSEINDNQWHVLRCERLTNRVTMYIDGVEVGRTVKPSGRISNTRNLSIAGKSNCDQITTTCDYFVGDIDWVRLERGDGTAQNKPPVARFTDSCVANTCSFNGSTSTDADGHIVSWAWDFGDGTTGTGQTSSHAYATGGTRTVKLTVTDDLGATHSVTHHTSPTAPPSTTSTTSTTTTIVGQLPPGFLIEIPDAADAARPATRLGNVVSED
jgi:hypothetical protein